MYEDLPDQASPCFRGRKEQKKYGTPDRRLYEDMNDQAVIHTTISSCKNKACKKDQVK